MLNIGRKQKLVVVKKVEFGIYLGETREAGEKERVLLPIKQVPEGTKEGDELEVFPIYGMKYFCTAIPATV